MNLLGIEIGGTKLQLVVGDPSAQIRERRRLTVDATRGAAGIREQIANTLPELLGQHNISAVGVGFGGPVDWRAGLIARSHQIEGWSGFELAAWLRGLAGVPVFVDNDDNVAALGEATRGAGIGFSPAFYVTLGSGIGGGLVVDGEIHHGAIPGEAEIGHIRLDRAGTTLESRCSGWAVDAKIRDLVKSQPDGLLARLVGNSARGEAKHLAPALHQGDEDARRILATTAEDLAFGLSHVVHLFHPQVIVLGGGLALVGEPLRAAVEMALRDFIMEVFAPGPALRLSALGEDAVPVGALRLAASARCAE